ncbi:MAG: cation diffusion facilitator family transporter [Candidatus Saccharibacteria bacterium]|nr:cation diffusion facilitator family transporter [Candidatus Saccharibacteria bacterium]
MKQKNDYQSVAYHVSTVSIIANALLSIGKFFAGVLANSAAMISDSIHSLSDVLSTVVVMIGVKISAKEPDENHPYGHERLECVAAILLASMLAAVGAGIGMGAVNMIINRDESGLEIPGVLALVASIVSIIVKEIMYQYTAHNAKKINSPALMADAWHHRSDALSSVGALIGIGGAMLGFPILDPIASIVICIFILKAALDIFADAVRKMTDHSSGEETEAEIRKIAKSVRGVKGIDSLKTREFGAKIYVDIEISVDGKMTLNDAHAIAERVHDKIEKKLPHVKHCMVHENPA